MFDPAAFVEIILEAARKGGWETRFLSPVGDWGRPWFQRHAAASNAPSLYISTGIHGDEPAGPMAALKLVRQPEIFHNLNIALFPILNPGGLKLGTRENPQGIDLNRDYLNPRSDEIRSHIAALQTLGPFDLTVCLHEDWESKGVYFYEVNLTGQPACDRAVFEAMTQHLPFETSPLIDGHEADNGIIRRNASQLDRPDWPEALYLCHHHTQIGYTFETPSKAAPLDLRVAAQVAGVRAIADYLRARPIP